MILIKVQFNFIIKHIYNKKCIYQTKPNYFKLQKNFKKIYSLTNKILTRLNMIYKKAFFKVLLNYQKKKIKMKITSI